ncbi:MAG: succinylglutamate desuccinylase/aspartoacylase family protein [Rhodobacteraceae bacterium]|nr:succinylglutamate desuccinylase/aspartoacylase family protein [Paracoccaceae bacterium]
MPTPLVSFAPSCEIDLDAGGKRHGYVRIQFSSHRSAYGWIPVPIMTIRGGEGPTALVIGANHGDEYEGISIASDLYLKLDVSDVVGRLILLPCANAPAAYAGRRTSPLDYSGEGNLNRIFPGDRYGTPTDMIAWFIANELVPRAEAVFDLHSAGSSIDHWPSCKIRLMGDEPEKDAMQMDILKLFGAPLGIVGNRVHHGTLSGETSPKGKIYVSTELGGAGRLRPWIREFAYSGMLRCLKRLGVLKDTHVVEAPKWTTRLMAMQTDENYVFAPTDGVFEPEVELGSEVRDGQHAGRVRSLKEPWKEPEDISFNRGGVVFCKRNPALCEIGDTLYFTLNDYERF